MDYPSLAFRMIIIFGTYIALQSGIAVNPYPTAPLKCVVIPQFAHEDAQAERLTPEWAKACAGISGFLQHSPLSPPPKCDFGWSGDYRGSLQVPGAFAGRGIWRWCSEMGLEAGGRGGSVGTEHILTGLTAASCVDHEVQIELLICQLHHADEELIPKLL